MFRKIGRILKGVSGFIKGTLSLGIVFVGFLATLQKNGPAAVKQARKWRLRIPKDEGTEGLRKTFLALERSLEKIVSGE